MEPRLLGESLSLGGFVLSPVCSSESRKETKEEEASVSWIACGTTVSGAGGDVMKVSEGGS